MSVGSAPLSYSRHELAANGSDAVEAIVRQLPALGNVVIVNIVGEADEPAVAWCTDNLRTALQKRPAAVIVEAIPRARFDGMLREHIGQTEQQAIALRQTLCTAYLADASGDASFLLKHLEQLLFLLDGLALQKPDLVPAAILSALEASHLDFVSGLMNEDSVLCMDAIHHQIVPALRTLMPSFPP
jgi:hypothetical protein